MQIEFGRHKSLITVSYVYVRLIKKKDCQVVISVFQEKL